MKIIEIELESIYVPGGHYISKTKAAEFLGIGATSLQHHIKAGNLQTVRCPSGCHMINEWDLLEFAENRRGPGKPTIYSKE